MLIFNQKDNIVTIVTIVTCDNCDNKRFQKRSMT